MISLHLTHRRIAAIKVRSSPIDKGVFLKGQSGYRLYPISDHQQSWGYEDGPWKGPGPPLLVAADF